MSHKNTSAMSTSGRFGEYSWTATDNREPYLLTAIENNMHAETMLDWIFTKWKNYLNKKSMERDSQLKNIPQILAELESIQKKEKHT